MAKYKRESDSREIEIAIVENKYNWYNNQSEQEDKTNISMDKHNNDTDRQEDFGSKV